MGIFWRYENREEGGERDGQQSKSRATVRQQGPAREIRFAALSKD